MAAKLSAASRIILLPIMVFIASLAHDIRGPGVPEITLRRATGRVLEKRYSSRVERSSYSRESCSRSIRSHVFWGLLATATLTTAEPN